MAKHAGFFRRSLNPGEIIGSAIFVAGLVLVTAREALGQPWGTIGVALLVVGVAIALVAAARDARGDDSPE